MGQTDIERNTTERNATPHRTTQHNQAKLNSTQHIEIWEIMNKIYDEWKPHVNIQDAEKYELKESCCCCFLVASF